MIAELFYPRELKDAIKKLRAENDLNEEALNSFLKNTLYNIFPLLVLACLFLFALELKDSLNYASLTCALFAFFILIKYFSYRTWLYNYAPYINYLTKTGIVTKFHFSLNGSKVLFVQDDETSSVIYIHILPLGSGQLPELGNKIEYFINDKGRSAPKLAEYMRKNCLRKSLIEDNNKC